jgi:glycosyltransferase involved in cell wall biosynthesis
MIVYTDARWPARTGIGVVQKELTARIPANLQLISLPLQTSIGSPLSPFALGRSLRRQTRAGVFWSPGFIPPCLPSQPTIVTVHDLTHLHYYSRLHALYYELVIRRLFKRMSALICVSNFTRQELLNWSGLSPDRVHVIHNGVSARFSPRVKGSKSTLPYVFYPGNRRRYKNIERLIRAYARSRLPTSGVRMMLTGVMDHDTQTAIRDVRCDESIIFCGNVDDEQLADLYRGAQGVVFISLYEGFGLPIIEGMASGVPVLTSDVSALPEIAGGAAILIDPLSLESIADGLERLVFDETERQRCISDGLARAAQFSWEAAATRTWTLVQGAAVT